MVTRPAFRSMQLLSFQYRIQSLCDDYVLVQNILVELAGAPAKQAHDDESLGSQ